MKINNDQITQKITDAITTRIRKQLDDNGLSHITFLVSLKNDGKMDVTFSGTQEEIERARILSSIQE
jgi:hypothetical protein